MNYKIIICINNAKKAMYRAKKLSYSAKQRLKNINFLLEIV